MAEPFTLYKLIILYMLRKVTFPLTNAQIIEYIVGREYTDYFHVQEVIHELLDAGLIECGKIRNTTTYQVNQAGETTLEYFSYMLSDEIKADIDDYLQENAFEMRNESCTIADYETTATGEYEVHCYVKEGNEDLIDLSFTVPTVHEAERVCERWPSRSQDIYMYVMEKLLMGSPDSSKDT